MTLADVVAPQQPVGVGQVELVATDLAAPGEAERLVEGRPDLIFHLAAVVSGEAEADFEGYRVNLDGIRALLEAVRAAHTADGSASSGLHVLDRCLRCAATQSHSRGFSADAIPPAMAPKRRSGSSCWPTTPGEVSSTASEFGYPPSASGRGPRTKRLPGFFSSILREPLVGQEAVLPVPETVRHWRSPRRPWSSWFGRRH